MLALLSQHSTYCRIKRIGFEVGPQEENDVWYNDVIKYHLLKSSEHEQKHREPHSNLLSFLTTFCEKSHAQTQMHIFCLKNYVLHKHMERNNKLLAEILHVETTFNTKMLYCSSLLEDYFKSCNRKQMLKQQISLKTAYQLRTKHSLHKG